MGAYKHFSGVFRLFDNRIMLAPEWFLSWKELGATVEINRAKNPDVPSTIRVHCYSAECPICCWMVKLDNASLFSPKESSHDARKIHANTYSRLIGAANWGATDALMRALKWLKEELSFKQLFD